MCRFIPYFSADGVKCICTELRCSRLFGCDSFEFGAAKEHGCNDSIKIRVLKIEINKKSDKTSRKFIFSAGFFMPHIVLQFTGKIPLKFQDFQ